jgi:hypothetical protein
MSRDMIPGSSEYEAGLPTISPQHSHIDRFGRMWKHSRNIIIIIIIIIINNNNNNDATTYD